MKAIVIGATGTIGKAVAALLEKKGYEVVGLSRSSNPAVNVDDSSTIDRLYERVKGIDIVICAAGNASSARLDALTDEQVQISLNSKLMGQINLVRKGMGKINPGGVFVVTGGILAYKPMPRTSMFAMVNAGLEGFVRGAALDLTEGRRIVIVHPPWIAETAASLGMDPAPWPKAEVAAQAYISAIESKQNGSTVFVNGYEPK